MQNTHIFFIRSGRHRRGHGTVAAGVRRLLAISYSQCVARAAQFIHVEILGAVRTVARHYQSKHNAAETASD